MPEQSFDPQQIGIAVITSYPKWYRGKLKSIKHTDKVRGDLALEFVQKARELGYHIVVTDGRSTKTFKKDLQAIPGAIVLHRKTITSGNAKRAAIDKVSTIPGVAVLVLSEPEKLDIVTRCLPDIVLPILENKADIVVPRRNDVLFKATHPGYMYESEIELNGIYNEALRSNNLLPEHLYHLDGCFGPRVFRNEKKLVSLFKRKYYFSGASLLEKLYNPDVYSNVLFFPLINALKQKLRVQIVEVAFSYPPLQKENEDIGQREIFIAKRNLQRVSILTELMHFLSFLQNNKNSRVRVLQ
jgi:hypothetical protein